MNCRAAHRSDVPDHRDPLLATPSQMDEETSSAADAETKSGKLPLVIAAVVSLAVGAGIGTVVLAPRLAPAAIAPTANAADSTQTDGKADGSHDEAAAAPMYALENIVLNPAGTNGSRYLLLTVALVLRDASGEATAKARDIEVRDRIVALLATQTVDDLVDPTQRDSVKVRIHRAVAPLFPEGAVRRVLLPQFVVQ